MSWTNQEIQGRLQRQYDTYFNERTTNPDIAFAKCSTIAVVANSLGIRIKVKAMLDFATPAATEPWGHHAQAMLKKKQEIVDLIAADPNAKHLFIYGAGITGCCICGHNEDHPSHI